MQLVCDHQSFIFHHLPRLSETQRGPGDDLITLEGGNYGKVQWLMENTQGISRQDHEWNHPHFPGPSPHAPSFIPMAPLYLSPSQSPLLLSSVGQTYVGYTSFTSSQAPQRHLRNMLTSGQTSPVRCTGAVAVASLIKTMSPVQQCISSLPFPFIMEELLTNSITGCIWLVLGVKGIVWIVAVSQVLLMRIKINVCPETGALNPRNKHV